MISNWRFIPCFLSRAAWPLQCTLSLLVYMEGQQAFLEALMIWNSELSLFSICSMPKETPTFASAVTNDPIAGRCVLRDVRLWRREARGAGEAFALSCPERSEVLGSRTSETRPFVWIPLSVLNCSWPHNCSLCTYTQTHLHSAGQTTDANPFVRSDCCPSQRLSTGRDINWGAQHRWKMFSVVRFVPMDKARVGFAPFEIS